MDSFRRSRDSHLALPITINHCQNLQQSWQPGTCSAMRMSHLGNRWNVADDPLRRLKRRNSAGIQQSWRSSRGVSAAAAPGRRPELSYEEIGDLTNQTADAVRGKLHRARKAFATVFKKTA
jgi:hypothetical protein